MGGLPLKAKRHSRFAQEAASMYYLLGVRRWHRGLPKQRFGNPFSYAAQLYHTSADSSRGCVVHH